MMVALNVGFEDEVIQVNVPYDPTLDELKYFIGEETGIDPEFQYLFVDNLLINENTGRIGSIVKTGDYILLESPGQPYNEFKEHHRDLAAQELSQAFFKEHRISYSYNKFKDGSCMIVKEIQKDNSCLFSAIQYAMFQNNKNTIYLRYIVADLIKNSGERFSMEQLGKNHEEYLEWIKFPGNWGGEIELILLSEHFSVEIVVITINPFGLSVFGECCGYRKRIFLLYTNSHYNLIVRNFLEQVSEMDVTVFRQMSNKNLRLAKEAAENYRNKHLKDELKIFHCEVCGLEVKGKSNASAHGQETGHSMRTMNKTIRVR